MTATHADWSALAGATVRATDADGAEHELVLSEVTDARPADGWVSYALRFRGGPDVSLEQQTYELAADGLREPVFLVPSGRTADAVLLEATFTQVAAPPAPQEES